MKPPLRWLVALALPFLAGPATAAWKRHTIDNSSRGADGVRLADINGDGLPDIATGFEQGGIVRVYLHPGHSKVRAPWPAVTVGKAGDVEDAVFVDLDGDGATDVVSSSEGKTQAMHVHWAPEQSVRKLEPAAWRTEPFPVATGRLWMFCLPMQIDGRHGPDLFVASKNKGAITGWLEAPADARKLADWKLHELRPAGWIMSLLASDMDGDGDNDLVFTDRKGARSGVFWLANPGPGAGQFKPWREHPIGGAGREVMFLQLADLDRDGLEDALVSVKPQQILFLRRLDRSGDRWETHTINCPTNTGTAKAVSAGDIDLDGQLDLVFSCEQAVSPRHGLMWLSNANPLDDAGWRAHELSGADGVKHDLVPLVDLDGDGDLDVITTEEVKNLGVIWYENPHR